MFFIGLSLSNYIDSDFGNTTLIVLTGWLKVQIDGLRTRIMSSGDQISIPSDRFHKITPIKSEPASYMLIYVNTTNQMPNYKHKYLPQIPQSDKSEFDSVITKHNSNTNEERKNAWLVRYDLLKINF